MTANNNPANYQAGEQVNYSSPKRPGRVYTGKVVYVTSHNDVVVEPRKGANYVYVPYNRVNRPQSN